MPTLEAVANQHAAQQKRIALKAAKKLAKLWAQTDPGNIVQSWTKLIPEAMAVLAQGQTEAAAGAALYVEEALLAQGLNPLAEGELAPTMLAGVASDGRDLRTLIYQPVVDSLVAVKRGTILRRAMAIGLNTLDMIGRTQISDAGRAAESVNTVVRPKVQGYVRMLSKPSCSRCIILAGKFYRWNTGFSRHPRCDCRHIPASENTAGDSTTDPKQMFHSLSEPEQNKIFGQAGAQALRDGADINQVVNARSGMYTAAGKKLTRSSTTRKGVRPGLRMMPEQIYIEAKGNRSEAIRLLRLHGYVR